MKCHKNKYVVNNEMSQLMKCYKVVFVVYPLSQLSVISEPVSLV